MNKIFAIFFNIFIKLCVFDDNVSGFFPTLSFFCYIFHVLSNTNKPPYKINYTTILKKEKSIELCQHSVKKDNRSYLFY